jgi:signal transduction histidine kinase
VSYQTAQKEKQLSENKLQLVQKDFQLQKNRYYMYYTLAALIMALLIVALLFVRSRHKKRMHEQQLKSIQQQKELQLLQALMQGEEKERSRIAKDLHDGVAGMLAAVKMHFSSMPNADDLIQVEGYQQGMKLLNEAAQEIRKTSHNLMPEVLLQHGLDEALRRYCNNVNNSKVLQIQYDSWGEVDRFNNSFELSVYRIVQELINNIIKHSKATHAIVQLSQQNDMLTISIEDNGVGFSGNDNGKDGMGLHSLQNRIKAMNGKLEMESSQQSGVSAYLEFEIAELKKERTAVYE